MTTRGDRAAKAARRLNLVRFIPTSPRERIAAAIRREVKRAVEEAAQIAEDFHANEECQGHCIGERGVIGKQIAAAIRARGKR